MSKSLSLFVLCILFCLPGVSLAEEKKKDKKSLATMDEVVVTATKTTEKRSDVPNSVIIMDKYDIQESPAQNLGELLANELGIDWRTYGNYGGASQEIHIRGMGGDGTQVFVNGVNINSPSLGTANVGAIPLNNIERIEVVKGAGSLLYGSGAMGGTVNIITKNPEKDVVDLSVTAGYGTNNAYQVSAEQGMYLTDHLGYYLTANRYETDGFRDNSDLTQNDMSLKLVLGDEDALQISLYGDYIDREYGLPGPKPPEGTQEYYVGGTKVYNQQAANLLNNGSTEDVHSVFELKSRLIHWLGLRFKADYTEMENYNYNRYVSAGTLPGSKTWTTNKISGFEANAEIEPNEKINVITGAEYKDYNWENKGVNLDGSGAELPATNTTTKESVYTTGTFGEVQYQVYSSLNVLVGLRHEKHSEFGEEDLPRYGLAYSPFENTVLKLSHGKHFKAPTPNDLFWPYEDWGFGMGTEGNPNLKPETGWHTDVTIEQALNNDKIFITFSYFEWDLKDKIRWVPDSSFFYRPENLDDYQATGWETGINIGPINSIQFSLSYTYLDAEEHKVDGVKRRALYTPENQFKGTLTYWMDFGLTASTTIRYVSDRPAYYDTDNDLEPSKTLDSYWTTDIKLEQCVSDHWFISLQGNNIFNKGYETYASSFRDNIKGVTTMEGYPGAERSVFLNLTYGF